MYAAHFGLTELPFRPLPDARFLVESPQQRAALAALTGAFDRGEPFMLLTGPWGTGKTLLAQRLVASLDPVRVHAARMLAGGRGGEELLRGVAMAFGAPLEDGVAPAAALIEALEKHGRAGRRMLLVLDEAQDLDGDALRRLRGLTELRVAGHAVFQCCLVGAQAPADLAPATPAARLGPLSREETQAYVVQRLQSAGWDARPGLDHDALGEIHRHSGGVPREINRLVHRTLIDLYRSGAARLSVASVAAAADALRAEDELRPIAPPPPTGAIPAAPRAPAQREDPAEPAEPDEPDEPEADLEQIMAAVTGPHLQPTFVSRWRPGPAQAEVDYPVAHVSSRELQTIEVEPADAPDETPTRRNWMPLVALAAAFAIAAAGIAWVLARGPAELGAPGAAPEAAGGAPRTRAVTTVVTPTEPPTELPTEPTASGCTSSARSLGLCGAATAVAASAAAPQPAPASAPPPPCDAARDALGLCAER